MQHNKAILHKTNTNQTIIETVEPNGKNPTSDAEQNVVQTEKTSSQKLGDTELQAKEHSSEGKEWLVNTLICLAVISFIASIIAAFSLGFTQEGYYYTHTEFNAPIFFGILLGGFFEFVLLHSLAVFVKAANKYLSDKSAETKNI